MSKNTSPKLLVQFLVNPLKIFYRAHSFGMFIYWKTHKTVTLCHIFFVECVLTFETSPSSKQTRRLSSFFSIFCATLLRFPGPQKGGRANGAQAPDAIYTRVRKRKMCFIFKWHKNNNLKLLSCRREKNTKILKNPKNSITLNNFIYTSI